MRRMIVPLAAAFSLCAMAMSVAQGAQELSEEDKNATPFPAGANAALVKKVCVDCHDAGRVMDVKYTREEAEALYKNMVSSDISTDQARKIIEYLVTHLGV